MGSARRRADLAREWRAPQRLSPARPADGGRGPA